MKRLDKIISEQTYYTRSEIKKLISKGVVFVNGMQAKKPETKYDETNVSIKIKDTEKNKLIYEDFGEMVFTHFGVSGPLIYTISSIKAFDNMPYKLNIDLAHFCFLIPSQDNSFMYCLFISTGFSSWKLN